MAIEGRAGLQPHGLEAYLVQMHGVAWYRVWKGVAEAGTRTPNQVVLWEDLMDGATLLLTGNCETVYGLCAIDLKRDGPVVIEAPAMLLGGIFDLWQREIMGIGPTGADKGKGGTNGARQRVVRSVPLLRATRAVLRQDMEAR
jgi:hypothetical protein